MEEATFLTRFASKVTIIHRRDVFKASKVMIERAESHPKIEIRTFKQIKEWLSDEKGLTGAILEDPEMAQRSQFGVQEHSLPSDTNQLQGFWKVSWRLMKKVIWYISRTP